jgi:hypothetical protein
MLGELLHDKGIDHSVQDNDPMMMTYRGEETRPYLIIETTQLFSNGNCAMTYCCEQWRKDPFATGDLGSIDISVTDSYRILISAEAPTGIINDESVLRQTIQQIEGIIAQGKGLSAGIRCDEFFQAPYITLGYAFTDPAAHGPEHVFNLIQLFALDVHRIFSSITVASGRPAPLPKSKVAYTPNAQNADGGYFVYGLDGDLWWVVDADFRFQSIVGEGAWREHKEAEADGLPLTAIDYDNLYRYQDGITYELNGGPVGRYYTERYETQSAMESAVQMLNSGVAENMTRAFNAFCDIYLLFPEKRLLYETLEEIVQVARRAGSNSGTQMRIFARTVDMLLPEFKQKCPHDSRIQQL